MTDYQPVIKTATGEIPLNPTCLYNAIGQIRNYLRVADLSVDWELNILSNGKVIGYLAVKNSAVDGLQVTGTTACVKELIR